MAFEKTTANSYPKIITDEAMRETRRHGSEDYPFEYYYEDIWLFDLHCIDRHWHKEVEFVYIESGSARVLIGSDCRTLQKGDAVFINSQVIHRLESDESTIIPNIVFSPLLLSPPETLIYRKYIRPVLDSDINYRIFSKSVPKEAELIGILMRVFEAGASADTTELQLSALIYSLWERLFELIEPQKACVRSMGDVKAQTDLYLMLRFIHERYPERITLEDIARHASLSKSSALNIFGKYMHTSPVSYLAEYRLKCAAWRLVTTSNSVEAIAGECGFESTGYFCRRFKLHYGITPTGYRKSAEYCSAN